MAYSELRSSYCGICVFHFSILLSPFNTQPKHHLSLGLLKMSQPPENFAASVKDFESWPENLVHQKTCLGVLKAYKTRLDVTEPKLFTQKAEDINVSFLELIESGPSTLVFLAPELYL